MSHAQQVPASGATSAPVALALNEQSDTVYAVTRAITRYGITTDAPNKWRYFLDSVEVHLPPFWEQHINDENSVELIPTDSLPLVITLNGHSLSDYRRSAKLRPGTRFGHPASIRGEESEQVELRQIRRETPEEHALNRPDGLREAILIVASFLFFYFSLIGPAVFTRLVAAGLLLLAAGLWGFMPAASRALREIHCLRGVLSAGDCLAKTIRSKSITSRWALSISSIRATGNPDCPDLGSRPILISISTATWPVRTLPVAS